MLVMISDNVPHEPGYTYGGKTYHINWRDECAALNDMGVKIYGVQAGQPFPAFAHPCPAATHFNEEMARITGGKRLTLKNFGCLFDILMMICYREGNPEMLAVYEQEIIDRGERMADDITSLKKTFGMPTTATTSPPMSIFMTPHILAGTLGKKTGKKAGKVKTKKTDTIKVKKNTGKGPGGKTAASKTIRAKKATKLKNVKLREKLPDSCMVAGPLKNLTWSKWICAIEPKLPTNKSKSKFVKLRTNDGYGPKEIFDGNFKVSAIYEMAVQMPGARKKYVVYFRMSKMGFIRRGHWSTHLLRHKKVRVEVNNVLKQGCSVYLRRGQPEAKTPAKRKTQMLAANNYIRDNYDFAWKKYIWRRSDGGLAKFGLKHRQLEIKRNGKVFALSDGTI